MNARELRASLALAGLAGLRMLGMFIILPIFGLYAEQLPGGGSHTLIGFALGAYGLTQALLQIPFGRLSDRWGRKRTIYMGLILLALGSFVAAAATDIYVMILGRVIQGAGAISAAVIALAADLTRDEQRTKAMAIIGMTIGATFSLSLIAGPVLGRAIGVPGVFAMTGALALAALAVVRWVVPDPPPAMPRQKSTEDVRLLHLLRNPDLVRLNWGIFVLHGVLMALFVVLPFALRDAGLPAARHWQIYLPVMVAAVLVMAAAFVDLRAAWKTESRVPGCHLCAARRRASAGRNAGLGARDRGFAGGVFRRVQPARGEPPVAGHQAGACGCQRRSCGYVQQRAVSRNLRGGRRWVVSCRSISARRRCSRCAGC